MHDVDGLLTPAQAARRLDLSPQRVKQLVANGRLSGLRTPLGHLIDPASVELLRLERERQRAERGALVSA